MAEFLVDIQTRAITDASGNPARARLLVVRVQDEGGRINVEGETTPFLRRNAFIAPNNTGDYPEDDLYAHVTGNDGKMSDDSEGYLII